MKKRSYRTKKKMPYRCCVPNCRGNSNSNTKVSIFRFPSNEILRKKWIQAIRRKNFTVTASSRVCEKHFKPSDIRRETSAYDEKNKRLLTAKLLVPKLQPGAIPSIFPPHIETYYRNGKLRKNSPPVFKKCIKVAAEDVKIETDRGGPNGHLKSPQTQMLYLVLNADEMQLSLTCDIKRDSKSVKKTLNSSDLQQEDSFSHPETVVKQEVILPDDKIECSQSQEIKLQSVTSSLFDPSIVIKQEVVETEEESPKECGGPSQLSSFSPRQSSDLEQQNATKLVPCSELTTSSTSVVGGVGRAKRTKSKADPTLETSKKARITATRCSSRTSRLLNRPLPSQNVKRVISPVKLGRTPSVSEVNAAEKSTEAVLVQPMDQFDAFGEYIASKLRRLDWKSRAFVQKAIGHLILEAEAGVYLNMKEDPDTASYVNSVTSGTSSSAQKASN